jgi:hypothetical protein
MEGTGNYTGSISTTFKIVKKNVSDSKVKTVSISAIPNQTYTGFNITPDLSVYYGDVNSPNENLVYGKDYTVEFTNNKDSQTVSKKQAVATITGKGNYTGTVTVKAQ